MRLLPSPYRILHLLLRLAWGVYSKLPPWRLLRWHFIWFLYKHTTLSLPLSSYTQSKHSLTYKAYPSICLSLCMPSEAFPAIHCSTPLVRVIPPCFHHVTVTVSSYPATQFTSRSSCFVTQAVCIGVHALKLSYWSCPFLWEDAVIPTDYSQALL